MPGASLVMQGAWTVVLVLIRTYNPTSGTYGNLYSNLLGYVVSAALLFYILTIAGVFRLRQLRPEVKRPYRAFGYPVVPALYLLGAAVIILRSVICLSSCTHVSRHRHRADWRSGLLCLPGAPVLCLPRASHTGYVRPMNLTIESSIHLVTAIPGPISAELQKRRQARRPTRCGRQCYRYSCGARQRRNHRGC